MEFQNMKRQIFYVTELLEHMHETTVSIKKNVHCKMYKNTNL